MIGVQEKEIAKVVVQELLALVVLHQDLALLADRKKNINHEKITVLNSDIQRFCFFVDFLA